MFPSPNTSQPGDRKSLYPLSPSLRPPAGLGSALGALTGFTWELVVGVGGLKQPTLGILDCHMQARAEHLVDGSKGEAAAGQGTQDGHAEELLGESRGIPRGLAQQLHHQRLSDLRLRALYHLQNSMQGSVRLLSQLDEGVLVQAEAATVAFQGADEHI